jgi:hypothetical protein
MGKNATNLPTSSVKGHTLPDEAEGVLPLPLKGLDRSQIESRVEAWIAGALEVTSSAELYVYVKQMEFAVKLALERLKEPAFDAIGRQLGGVMEGGLLGHRVRLSYPREWIYSENVAALKERQKLGLKSAELTEQASGAAKRIDRLGVITVTLRGGAR